MASVSCAASNFPTCKMPAGMYGRCMEVKNGLLIVIYAGWFFPASVILRSTWPAFIQPHCWSLIDVALPTCWAQTPDQTKNKQTIKQFSWWFCRHDQPFWNLWRFGPRPDSRWRWRRSGNQMFAVRKNICYNRIQSSALSWSSFPILQNRMPVLWHHIWSKRKFGSPYLKIP